MTGEAWRSVHSSRRSPRRWASPPGWYPRWVTIGPRPCGPAPPSSTAPARPNLFLGKVPDGEHVDLTIFLVVVERRLPYLGDMPASDATDPVRGRRLGHRTGAGPRRRRGGRCRSPHRRNRGRRSRPDRSHLRAAHHRGEIQLADAADAPHRHPIHRRHHRRPATEPDHEPTLERGAAMSTTTRRSNGRDPSWSACTSFAPRCLRRLWVCVLCAVLGLLGAGAFMLAFPPAARGQGVAGADL